MVKYIIAGLFVLTACGCAQQAKQEQEPRQKVSPSQEKKHKVVERDGKYYIMMEEHERLCSDCDR